MNWLAAGTSRRRPATAIVSPEGGLTMPHYEAFAGGGPPHQGVTTTAANPYAANPSAIASDCTIFVPRVPCPPQTGVADLEAVKQALQAGKKPG
jgi:hypothetical protein